MCVSYFPALNSTYKRQEYVALFRENPEAQFEKIKKITHMGLSKSKDLDVLY